MSPSPTAMEGARVDDCAAKPRRILYVTPHAPGARAYGAQQRVRNIGRLLASLGQVSVVIALPESWPVEAVAIERTREEFDLKAVIRLPSVERLSVVARLRHELDPGYPLMYGVSASPADWHRVDRLVRGHDIVWVHTDSVATALGIDQHERTVLDADDLISLQYHSRRAIAEGWADSARFRRMEWIWKRRERRFPRRFSAVCVCSEEDRAYLGSHPRVFVLPNSVADTEIVPAARRRDLQRLGFLGNLAHGPNAEGLDWFLRHVWPAIAARFAGVEFRILGEGTQALTAARARVMGLGWRSDVHDEIATWSAMIVPVRVGSGTRVKIAEAFARKCPVVSTPYGAYGYAVRDGRELLLAESADAFAAACARLLTEPDLRERLSECAHDHFEQYLRVDGLRSVVASAIDAAAPARDVESRALPDGEQVYPRAHQS